MRVYVVSLISCRILTYLRGPSFSDTYFPTRVAIFYINVDIYKFRNEISRCYRYKQPDLQTSNQRYEEYKVAVIVYADYCIMAKWT